MHLTSQFTLNTKFFWALPILFITAFSLVAQTVEYDGTADNRPTAINGLEIDGITYNIAFDYNPLPNTIGENISRIPLGQEEIARDAIAAVLNSTGQQSAATRLWIISYEDAGVYKILSIQRNGMSASLLWFTRSTFTRTSSTDLITKGTAQAVLKFTPIPDAIPTLTQWGLIILGLLVLNIGLVFVYKKQLLL